MSNESMPFRQCSFDFSASRCFSPGGSYVVQRGEGYGSVLANACTSDLSETRILKWQLERNGGCCQQSNFVSGFQLVSGYPVQSHSFSDLGVLL